MNFNLRKKAEERVVILRSIDDIAEVYDYLAETKKIIAVYIFILRERLKDKSNLSNVETALLKENLLYLANMILSWPFDNRDLCNEIYATYKGTMYTGQKNALNIEYPEGYVSIVKTILTLVDMKLGEYENLKDIYLENEVRNLAYYNCLEQDDILINWHEFCKAKGENGEEILWSMLFSEFRKKIFTEYAEQINQNRQTDIYYERFQERINGINDTLNDIIKR